MRNKIKQLLNKEEGFTLIELLGVIVILGLLIAIAIPSIGGIVEKSKDKTAKAQEELIIDAAQMYFIQGGTGETVTVDNLVSGGYLESKITTNDNNTKKEVTRIEAMKGLEATSTSTQ